MLARTSRLVAVTAMALAGPVSMAAAQDATWYTRGDIITDNGSGVGYLPTAEYYGWHSGKVGVLCCPSSSVTGPTCQYQIVPPPPMPSQATGPVSSATGLSTQGYYQVQAENSVTFYGPTQYTVTISGSCNFALIIGNAAVKYPFQFKSFTTSYILDVQKSSVSQSVPQSPR